MHVDDIPLREQCCEAWNTMIGDEVRRHCDVCDHDVINLSALTQAEAREVLEQTSPPCVRYTYDTAGNIVFMHPQLRRQRRGLEQLLAAAALVTPILLGAASSGSAMISSGAYTHAPATPAHTAASGLEAPLADAEKTTLKRLAPDDEAARWLLGVSDELSRAIVPSPVDPALPRVIIEEDVRIDMPQVEMSFPLVALGRPMLPCAEDAESEAAPVRLLLPAK